ncbi:hypothetical protein PV682_00945 [Streptomyces niveiscabiei]|uniref:hypothetical protein n=1 Tax=Streptomyces niveiscabiei TaxID=164115 RepID=UPI0029BAB61C|nr:hypothetical protein [Streptomyces niveiscabiei]MDX3380010.1 hypothetical protein [Streptomyces niveiscabiei]
MFNQRLRVVFDDLRKTFGDVALRQGSTYEELGRAITHVPGAPQIGNPGVLPMAPGETLLVSGGAATLICCRRLTG